MSRSTGPPPTRTLTSTPLGSSWPIEHFSGLPGLELSLFANRVVIGLWQLAAAAILLWAVLPALGIEESRGGKIAAAGVVVGAVLASSLLAPHVHPDHPMMVGFALAVALVVAEERFPRRAFVALLVLVTPLATAFKLTGAGIGVGLVLVFGWQRRWKEIGWLGLSAVLALGTVPLYDAWFGSFSEYAIDVLSAQPLHPSRLVDAVGGPAGAVVALALVAWVSTFSSDGTALRRKASSVALLSLGMASTAAFGFAKYGGRANSLTPLLLGAAVLLLLSFGAPKRSSLLGPAVAWMALVLVPSAGPVFGASRDQIVSTHRTAVEHLQREEAAGRRTLLYSGTAAWLEAGRRESSARPASVGQRAVLRGAARGGRALRGASSLATTTPSSSPRPRFAATRRRSAGSAGKSTSGCASTTSPPPPTGSGSSSGPRTACCSSVSVRRARRRRQARQ